MSALDRVRAGGRSLDRRLDSVPAEALLAGLRAAGAVSEPEVAALGPPASSGWARRLRALAVAKGGRTCDVLLSVLQRLEGPPRPGPFDFYDPQRDAAPAHRSDCPCCRPEPEWTRGDEEEAPAEIGDEGHEEEEESPKNEDDEGPEEDDDGGGDEGPEEDDGGGDEGPEEDDDGGGDEGPEEEEPKNGDEGPEEDDDGGGGDDGGGDEGPEDDDGGGDDGGGDEGPGDDDEGGGGDED